MVNQSPKSPDKFQLPASDAFVFFSGADAEVIKQLPKSDAQPFERIGLLNFCIAVISAFSVFQVVTPANGFGDFTRWIALFVTFIVIAMALRMFCGLLLQRNGKPYMTLVVILFAVLLTLGNSIFLAYGFTYENSAATENERLQKEITDSLHAHRTDSLYASKVADSLAISNLDSELTAAAQNHYSHDPVTLFRHDSLSRIVKRLENDSASRASRILYLDQISTKRRQELNARQSYAGRSKSVFDSRLTEINFRLSSIETDLKYANPKGFISRDSLLNEQASLLKEKKTVSDSIYYYEQQVVMIDNDSLLNTYMAELKAIGPTHTQTVKALKAQRLQLGKVTLTETQRLEIEAYEHLSDSLNRLIGDRRIQIALTDSLLVHESEFQFNVVVPEGDFDHYVGLAFQSNKGLITDIISTLLQLSLWGFSLRLTKKGREGFYGELLLEKEKLSKKELVKEREKRSTDYRIRTSIEQTKALVQEGPAEYADDSSVEEFLSKTEDLSSPESRFAAAEFAQKTGDNEGALEFIDQAIELNPGAPDYWLFKSTLLGKMGRLKEQDASRQRYVQLQAKINFDRNLQRKIIVREVELNNLPFYGSFKWSLRSRMNILLGKNGYGKSHLLSIMLAQLQEESMLLTNLSKISTASRSGPAHVKVTLHTDENENAQRLEETKKLLEDIQNQRRQLEAEQNKELRGGEQKTADSAIRLQKELDTNYFGITKLQDEIEHLKGRSLFDRSAIIKSSYGKIPVLAIPDSRFVNKSSNYTQGQGAIDDEAKKILEFGAYHFIRQAPYEQVIQNFLNTLAVIYFEQSGTFNDEVFRLINRVFRKLTGNEFRWHEIVRTQDGSSYEIKVLSEGESEALPIQKVSQGTLSVLSMIGVIFHYLDLRYGQTVERSALTKQPAIVVIDEIDAHLHPSWQQKIIGILRAEFPNVQFIISAHSPVIVAGCKEGEVAVMRKTQDGFAIETIYSHLIGMPIADLFELVFEIEEKDETYLQLAALLPFKGMILKEIETLKSAKSLNTKDKARLEELEEQAANFNYFESFQGIKNNKAEKEELQRKYEELKTEHERVLHELNEINTRKK